MASVSLSHFLMAGGIRSLFLVPQASQIPLAVSTENPGRAQAWIFTGLHKATRYYLVRAETEALHSTEPVLEASLGSLWSEPWGRAAGPFSQRSGLQTWFSPCFSNERKGVPEVTWTNSQCHCFSLGTGGWRRVGFPLPVLCW